MNRTVPLWLLLFCILLLSLFTVLFGWIVLSQVSGGSKLGNLGRAAVQIASFPTTAEEVFAELHSYVSDEYKDEHNRVIRDATADYTAFKPIRTSSGIDAPNLLIRAELPRIATGWRLLAGAFHINGNIENAALLLAPDLTVVRMWILDETAVGGEAPRPQHRKFVHGVAPLKDGSLIVAFDGGMSLQRFNACGDRQWTIRGKFHHSVTLDDTGESVWALYHNGMAQVATKDGKIIRQFSADDIIAANPTIDLLEIGRVHDNDLGKNSRNTSGFWPSDAIHFNDVEPLPAAFADQFPEFKPGDLLISARNLNLIFVLDSDTLKIKWWRVGAVQRQHDPDWLPNGEIMVLNNRMSRDYSEIVSINPRTFARTVMLDGRANDFYTRIRGKAQMLDSGSLVVTSTQQGRAFEINRQGEVVLEIANTKPGSDTYNYVVSELKWLPPDYFEEGTSPCRLQN